MNSHSLVINGLIFFISLCVLVYAHIYGAKKLYKTADIVMELPPHKVPPWLLVMHEPLIIAFVLPFVSFLPWVLRSSAPVLELGQ
jgi:hypothetical protein